MTSPKQVEANRRNAQKSTGPKTPQGKESVRWNALRHGLRAQEMLLPDEDPQELEELLQALGEDLQPQGSLEEQLVQRITQLTFRLARARRIEAGVLWWFHFRVRDERLTKKQGKTVLGWAEDGSITMVRPEGGLTGSTASQDSDTEAALQQEEIEIETGLASEAAVWGEAAIRSSGGGDVLSKMSRYESNLERGLYKAMHELERLQKTRQGQDVPAPHTVDVTISGQSSAQQ